MTYTRKEDPAPDPRRSVAPPATPPAAPYIRPKFAGLSRSAVALFRVGTRRARVAAALMIVAGSLLYQTGAEALQESSKKVLYLDAPSVSVPEAEKAGETARGYAGPDSSVEDAVLAWVDVKPVPRDARKAFASITEPSGQPPGGVAYDDAVAAGEVMVAQLGGDSPAGNEEGDEELASADPVRPELGDGTKTADAPAPNSPRPNGAEQPPAQTGSAPDQPEYAAADTPAPSDLGMPAPMAEDYAPEPSAGQPPDSSGDELAAAPQEVSEGAEEATGGNSATGPISDDYSPQVGPEDNIGSGSSDTGDSAPQDDETSPTIVVPASPESGGEPEQEYAGAAEGSEAEPETSEPESSEPENPETEDVGSPPEQASSDPSTEPSPAQGTSPGSEEEEPDDSSDLVAVVPYDPDAEEGQEEEGQGGPGQSSQSPEEVPVESMPGTSGESSSEQNDSAVPEPDQQQEMPEQAATPAPAGEEPTEEEPSEDSEQPAVQPEASPDGEPGDGEDTENMESDEELPEGVQVESSDEAGVQKVSVVVRQESEASDPPAGSPAQAQDEPEAAEDAPEDESTPSESSPFDQPSPALQENQDHPSSGRGESNSPEGGRDPEPSTSEQPGSQSHDKPGRAPTSNLKNENDPEADQNDHNAGGRLAPKPETGDETKPSSTESQRRPEQAPEPASEPEAGSESGPQTTSNGSGDKASQRGGQQQGYEQTPSSSSPESAPAPKDQTPRQNAEGAGEDTQGDNEVINATRVRGQAQDKDQRPQQKQQRPSQPAREPRQTTEPGESSPDGREKATAAQGPTQSADAVQISFEPPQETQPRAEPQAGTAPAQNTQPTTGATSVQQGNQAALQNQLAPTPEPVVPEISPENAPAKQTSAELTGWVEQDPAAAARQAARQERRAARQAANQAAQPVDPATQNYAEPAVDQGRNQTTQQATNVVQDQGVADTGVPVGNYAAHDAGTQVSKVPVGVEEVDSYVQEAVGNVSETVTPVENGTDPYADSYVEPSTEPSVEPATSTYEVPGVEDATGYVEESVQESYGQEAVDPYVEDVAAEVAPATDPATYGAEVDPASYNAPAVHADTYEAPAPADAYTETYTEPAAQVHAQELEPVQQVPAQELEPAPQVDNVLSSEPAAAQPSEAAMVADSGAVSPTTGSAAQQEVAATVDASIQQTVTAGGEE